MEKTDDFQSQFCPLCGAKAANFHKADGVRYFDCSACDFIFADTALLAAIDRGETLRKYDRDYWTMELPAARERSFGPALIRTAEAILYARRNIKSFLDIGSGPGYLLDALAFYLPNNSSLFYGIETHPPPPRYRSKHPNYLVGDLKSLATRGFRFQAGVCIEVIEHLTPSMLKKLAADLARISDEQSLYIFNTGLTAYVKNETWVISTPCDEGLSRSLSGVKRTWPIAVHMSAASSLSCMYPRDISSSAKARRTMSLMLQNSAVASAAVAKIISGGTANVMRGVLMPSFLFAIVILLLCHRGTAFRFQF